MSKKATQADFERTLLDTARQVTNPAAIVPLIRMAKQADTKRKLRQIREKLTAKLRKAV